jgi:hypothetical protein
MIQRSELDPWRQAALVVPQYDMGARGKAAKG